MRPITPRRQLTDQERAKLLREMDKEDEDLGGWLLYYSAGEHPLCPRRLLKCAAWLAQHDHKGQTPSEALFDAGLLLRHLDGTLAAGNGVAAKLVQRIFNVTSAAFRREIARCGTCPVSPVPAPKNFSTAARIFSETDRVAACNITPVVQSQQPHGAHKEQTTMQKTTTTNRRSSKKTTAADEKARREALNAVKPAAEAVAGKQITKKADGTKRGAASSKGIRDAKKLAKGTEQPQPEQPKYDSEQARIRAEVTAVEETWVAELAEQGIELAENERVYDPRTTGELPADAKVKKVTKRGDVRLAHAIFVLPATATAAPVAEPQPEAAPASEPTEAELKAQLGALNKELKSKGMAQQGREAWEEYGRPLTVEALLLAINPPKAGSKKGAAKGAGKGAAKGGSKKASGGGSGKPYCGTDPTQGKAKQLMDEVKKAGAKGLNASVKYPRTGGANQYPNRVLEALTRGGHLRVEVKEVEEGSHRIYFLAGDKK